MAGGRHPWTLSTVLPSPNYSASAFQTENVRFNWVGASVPQTFQTEYVRVQTEYKFKCVLQVCRVQWQIMRTTDQANEVMSIMNDIKQQFEAHTSVQGASA